MELTDHEYIFVQNQNASDFVTYLRSVWSVWPTLKYAQARKKTSKLWKARKIWLKTLEPTLKTLENSRCKTCSSSFHEIWQPLVTNPISDNSSKTVLTVTQWEAMLGSEVEEPLEGKKNDVLCWGCKEDQPNQLAHMEYGGCLYYDACEMGLADPFDTVSQSKFPLLPASPNSTD